MNQNTCCFPPECVICLEHGYIKHKQVNTNRNLKSKIVGKDLTVMQNQSMQDSMQTGVDMEYKFTASNFDTEVLQSDKPVLVDFYADWCGPCKMMGPIVDQLAEEMGDSVKIGKLNVDEEMEIAEKYRVMNIPTMIIFKDGKEFDKSIGALSKADLKNKLTAALN